MSTTQKHQEALSNGRKGAHAVASTEHDPGMQGLSKREYFAVMVMQGLCANGAFMEALGRELRDGEPTRERLAITSVATADALLLALETVKQ